MQTMDTTYSDQEVDALCATLAQEPARVTTAWAFIVTLRRTHQRGAGYFTAPTSDLGLPVGAWPAKLFATLPDHRHVLLVHAWSERGGSVHVYRSVKPNEGIALVVWAD